MYRQLYDLKFITVSRLNKSLAGCGGLKKLFKYELNENYDIAITMSKI